MSKVPVHQLAQHLFFTSFLLLELERKTDPWASGAWWWLFLGCSVCPSLAVKKGSEWAPVASK